VLPNVSDTMSSNLLGHKPLIALGPISDKASEQSHVANLLGTPLPQVGLQPQKPSQVQATECDADAHTLLNDLDGLIDLGLFV